MSLSHANLFLDISVSQYEDTAQTWLVLSELKSMKQNESSI